ncbi:hypothetical protein [Polaribacter atrinae]|uniref:Uncharacterized protein n=1 Tax=Polaribacter atrinae TaxID=1333662 RepID=A0A176TDH1_9FLAO|nr:hypothetical protein [Polaribacter atrinae]OAD45957.1 hypothetical protein LPB303_04645 [Polaribacter atrinae]
MSSKESAKSKKDNFIKYWEPKRTQRVKYALLQSLYFAIPFGIVFQFIESVQGFLTLQFVTKVLTLFCVYFLLSYYVSFTIYEKKYQRLKKEA